MARPTGAACRAPPSCAKTEAGTRRRLEAAGAPAAVEVEPAHIAGADDRARIRAHVYDAAPLPVHAHAAERRKQLADRLQRVFHDVKRAALTVAVVGIRAGADHQIALVRLADVAMHGVGHHHRIEARLQRLGNQRLQRPRLDRQAQPSHRRQHAAVAGGDAGHLLSADEAVARLDTDHRALALANADHFGVLDEVHALRIRRARKTPRHRIVPRHAATRLPGSAQYRIAGRSANSSSAAPSLEPRLY